MIKSSSIIEKALSGVKHLTREELMTQLQKSKIVTSDLRAAHIMHQAELDGVVCNGIMRCKNQTYVLLEERVPKTRPIKREEALAKLAERYFKSHGPAKTDDFIWWSGLNITDGKSAMEMIKEKLFSETIKSKTYWLHNTFSASEKFTSSLHVLPAFDEFIISYKDRTAMLNLEHHHKAFSSNGIFYPVIIMNGKVIGLWKRDVKKDLVIIQTELFTKISKSTMNSIEKKFNQFGKFLEKKTEVHFK